MPELQGKGLLYRSPIVRMRQLFDLYICLRPIKAYPGNPLNFKDGLDLVVFRENTEDLYAGVEFSPVPRELADTLGRLSKAFGPFGTLNTDEYAISCKINTRKGSERIIRAAFDFARTFGRKKVTVVHKANVVRATDGLFLETAKEVAKGYPDIAIDDANIDAMTMWLLKNPFNYDVLVAPNLYGDIVSDLCAQMVGGLGFGCSGNIGDKLAVFEPTHGSAPKHAGKYKANPIATILAVKMMLDWLGETGKAPGAGAGDGRRDQGRHGPHLRHGRQQHDARDGQALSRRGSDSGDDRLRAGAPRRSVERVSMTDLILHDVGLRDGLQIEKATVPTEQKIRWIEALAASGVDIIQVGSFVHPQKVPQMADTDALFAYFNEPSHRAGDDAAVRPGAQREGPGARLEVRRRVLLHGRLRQRHAQPQEHGNEHRGSDRSHHRHGPFGRIGRRDGPGLRPVGLRLRLRGDRSRRAACWRSRGGLSRPISRPSAWPTRRGTPPRTRSTRLFTALAGLDPAVECACHFHNTYGLGLANVYAAMTAGVRYYEAAFAGLGGCPFTAVAGANVCTEDLVHMWQRMGRRLDISLDRLIDVARDAGRFLGREMTGMVSKTGPITVGAPRAAHEG